MKPTFFYRLIVLLLLAKVMCACSSNSTNSSPAANGSTFDDFYSPTVVTIQGYDDHAMEPFLSRDGRYLFFNNSNDPGVDTDLHFAEQITDTSFNYRGPLVGANSRALDGVSSMDMEGNLYFVSTRSYDQTLETIHRGHFTGDSLKDVELVRGISRGKPARINFDVEVTADGNVLCLSNGLFTGDPVPQEANLALAFRFGEEFVLQSETVFTHVNTKALEYGAAISMDGLELFFTRLTATGPIIFRTTRTNLDEPFKSGQRVKAIQGFVEAPTLGPDGKTLYYHRKDPDGRFRIYQVRR